MLRAVTALQKLRDINDDESYNFVSKGSNSKAQVQFEFTLLYLSSKKRARITVKILKYTIEELTEDINDNAGDKLLSLIGIEVRRRLEL